MAQDETEDGTKNRSSEAREWFGHPYPYQTFAFIVGFILVFRSNFGYGRYWEGRTNLQVRVMCKGIQSDFMINKGDFEW